MKLVKVEIVKALSKHAKYIAKNIRQMDRQELYDYAAMSATKAVMLSFHNSKKCWAGLVDGVPVCIFGTVEALKDVGYVWLVGTDEVETYAKQFLSLNKMMIPQLMNGFKKIENYVGAKNEKSIIWLKWLGFKFGETKQMGPFNKPFTYFYMEKR